ncbi:MAG: hypothetical protein M4579_002835 [Chaenotheca gracillima]|nr:MAG: hypothetical protein M4579_002835 [Chaenotheca gracillima]
MAENAPTPTASGAGVADTRGLPYYEKLRRDLRETLQKKRLLDKNMASLEEQIFKHENAYLEETSAGNIIKGFDNYIKGSSGGAGGGAGGAGRKRAVVNDADRVFSRSSASFSRVYCLDSMTRDQIEGVADAKDTTQDSRAPTPTSAQTTPSHAPTPSSSFPQRDSGQPTPTSATGGGPTTTKASKKNKKGASASGVGDDGADEDGGRKRIRVSFSGRGDA